MVVAGDDLVHRAVPHGDGVLEDGLAVVGLDGDRRTSSLSDSGGIPLCSPVTFATSQSGGEHPPSPPLRRCCCC